MEAYEGWAILELMGHKRLAGYVREVELFGKPLIAVDMTSSGNPLTQFYSPDALYCMTPTTESVVKAVQSRMNDPVPVLSWEIPALAEKERKPDSEPDLDLEYIDDEWDDEPEPYGSLAPMKSDDDIPL